MGCCSSDPFTNTHTPTFTVWLRLNRCAIIGHRGGSTKYPENSLAALKDAQACGADGVELDVMRTKDGKIIVFHDEDTERLTGEKHIVAETDWATLSKLRLKQELVYDGITLKFDKREKIPLLEEVFEAFKGTDFILNVELKPPNPGSGSGGSIIGTEVAQLVRKHNVARQVNIVGFDFLKLRAVEKEFPGLNSGFQWDDGISKGLTGANKWYENDPDPALKAEGAKLQKSTSGEQGPGGFVRWLMESTAFDRAIGASVVDIEHAVMDDDTVAKFKAKGFAVGAYTLWPYDLAACLRKPPSSQNEPEAFYEDSKNVLRKLMAQRVHWVEVDDVNLAIKAMKEIQIERGTVYRRE